MFLNFNLKSTPANMLWALLLQTIEKAAGYLILAALTRSLLKIDLGAFFFTLSLAELTAVFFNFGTDAYLIRKVATNPQHGLEHLSQILSLRFVSMGVGYCLLNGSIWLLRPELLSIMLLVAASDFLEEIYYSISAFLTGSKQLFHRLVILGGFKILTFAGISLVAYTTRALLPVLWTYFLMNLILVLAAIRWVQTLFGALRFQFGFEKNRAVLQLSAPFFVLNILNILHMRFDTILVGVMLGFQQVANYELGIKMLEVARFFVRPLYSVYFPLFSEYVAHDRLTKLRIRLRQLTGLSFAAGIALASVMWAFGEVVITWLFGPNYQESVLPARVLFLSLPFLFAGYVANIAANAMHLEQKAARVLAFSVLVNLSLNIFVIPTFGITGAACVTVLSLVIWAAGMLILVSPVLFKRN